MRISTGQIYNQNIRSIMENQQGLTQTQQQLSTGKRINSPSDDPVGATKVLRLTEELDQLNQYKRNNDLLTSSLERQETILSGITSAVDQARVLTVQAGSGALSEADRSAVATELKQIRDELFDLMNSKDANGNYIYSGHQAGTQAFTMNLASAGNAFTFNGDGGKNFVQVSDSARIQSSTSGLDVFENVAARRDFTVDPLSVATVTASGVAEQQTFDAFYANNYDGATPANNDYQLEILAGGTIQMTNVGTGAAVGSSDFTSGQPFTINGMEFTVTGAVGDTVDFSLDAPQKKNLAETVNDLYVALSTPGLSDEDLENVRKDTLVGLDNGMEKVSLERSSVGGRLSTAASVYETNLDLEVATKASRSAIEDIDYAEASIEFAKQDTALNAALASFPKVTNLSLFNYI